MSFFKKIQQYISRINDEEAPDIEIDDSPITPPHTIEKVKPAEVTIDHKPQIKLDRKPQVDPNNVSIIFNRVIEVFNSSLPEFLSSAVDKEAQKKYLYDALDSSMKEYLTFLEEDANKRSMAKMQNERNEQKRKIDALNQRISDTEKNRNEVNEQRLSAERQKRALTERVRDLEKKIAELEADREQLEIENKGLINKAKVANVYEADMEEMRKEIIRLQSISAPQVMADENSRLKAQYQQQKAENDRQAQEIKKLNDDLAKMSDACQAAKVKDEMGEAMVKDMQKLASDANKNLKEAQQQIRSLSEEIKLRDAKIKDMSNQIAEKDAKIADDADTIAEIDEIVVEVQKFGQVKKRLDDRIAKLRDELKEQQRENDNLRTTIKNNLYAHAQQQKALQDEIDQFKRGIRH